MSLRPVRTPSAPLAWPDAIAAADLAVSAARPNFEARADRLTERLLDAFRAEHVAVPDFVGTTGYGYQSTGRDKLDRLYARALGAEAAVVRPQWASGTAAIAAMLWACARPGSELVIASGPPYDTLAPVLGSGEGAGLAAWGVKVRVLPVDSGCALPPVRQVMELLSDKTSVVHVQRSSGYADRPPLSGQELDELSTALARSRPDVYLTVDNCYGEFVDDWEPPQLGAYLTAGSLIKHPGGGLAPCGGYVAGRREGVVRAAAHLTAAGQALETGPWPSGLRLFFQGLLEAPEAVGRSLLGGVFAAALWCCLGGQARPLPGASVRDGVVRLSVGDPKRLIAAIRAIQAVSPVDSQAVPAPEAMAGYADPIIMAGGSFVEGSTFELSADAPLRPPYALYFQPGPFLPLARRAAIEAAMVVFGGDAHVAG